MTLHLLPHEWAALAVAFLACLADIPTRKIPNLLTFGAALLAFVYSWTTNGPWGLLMSLGGWSTGCAFFLPIFLLRGLGAGDVKLAAAIGAWLLPGEALRMSLYATIAGGVMALVVALGSGYLRTAVDNLYLLLSHFRVAGLQPYSGLTLERGKGPRLPYALPIAAGTLAALWLP